MGDAEKRENERLEYNIKEENEKKGLHQRAPLRIRNGQEVKFYATTKIFNTI
jgi:hypothetical protein